MCRKISFWSVKIIVICFCKLWNVRFFILFLILFQIFNFCKTLRFWQFIFHKENINGTHSRLESTVGNTKCLICSYKIWAKCMTLCSCFCLLSVFEGAILLLLILMSFHQPSGWTKQHDLYNLMKKQNRQWLHIHSLFEVSLFCLCACKHHKPGQAFILVMRNLTLATQSTLKEKSDSVACNESAMLVLNSAKSAISHSGLIFGGIFKLLWFVL